MSPNPPLHFWPGSWDLREAECPCDVHMVDWLDEKRIRDATLFHFGTGAHHHVGIECASQERRNTVMGITASPQEYEAYMALAINRPNVLRFYTAIFGDIYLLNAKLLPKFDVVTLFHLCEFRGRPNDAYDAMTDLEVANLLTDATRPGGHILFYTKSFAFDRADNSAKDVIARWKQGQEVECLGTFKTLLIYRKMPVGKLL